MITDQKIKRGFVGAYLLDGDLEGTKLAITRRPTGIQRFFTWLLLGWKWANLKDLKTKKENVEDEIIEEDGN